MRQALQAVVLAALTLPVMTTGQTPDASTVMTDVRRALANEKIASLTITGRIARVGSGGAGSAIRIQGTAGAAGTPTPATPTATEREVELNLQLPDKFMQREVVMALGNMSVYRNAGFNGADGLINEMDQPPQLAGGGVRMVIRSGTSGPGAAAPTPEQLAEQRRTTLLNAKKEFARLSLGLLGAAPSVYPLQLTYAAQADSPDGIAHVIDVKGEGDFAARLFVDTKTSLPLMLTWMDKEPLQLTVNQTMTLGARPSQEELEKQMRERQEQMKEAEAKRRLVEYRLFYGDYKTVAGAKLPHSFRRSIDGKVVEELTFDRVRVNQKIDEDKFRVTK